MAGHWISNAKAASVEFSNIKETIKVGVILQEEGKQGGKVLGNGMRSLV